MGSLPKNDLYIKIADEFMAENPNYHVTFEWIAHTDFAKKLPTAIAAGAQPDSSRPPGHINTDHFKDAGLDPDRDAPSVFPP